jgi:hypothetical protein
MGTSVNQADEAAQGAHSKDEAIAIVGEEQHAIDPIVAARAVRKIDMFLIPAMIIGCTYVVTCIYTPTDGSQMVWFTTTKPFLAQLFSSV